MITCWRYIEVKSVKWCGKGSSDNHLTRIDIKKIVIN